MQLTTKKIGSVILSGLCLLMSAACTPADKHLKRVRDDSGDRISVGKVQREIRVGMASSDVVQVLGSPNIVTTNDQRQEEWVYDKVATETAYSKSSGGFSTLVLGMAGSVAGGVAPSYSKSTGAESRSQRTLTIIVKFDHDQKVRDFAYHTSKF